jgi:hypothetical protein
MEQVAEGAAERVNEGAAEGAAKRAAEVGGSRWSEEQREGSAPRSSIGKEELNSKGQGLGDESGVGMAGRASNISHHSSWALEIGWSNQGHQRELQHGE